MADRIGYRRIYMICALTLIFVTYPLFTLLTFQNVAWVIISYFIFSFIFGFIPSAYSAMLSKLFPTPVRYSGIALSYNAAFAICGGLGPLICTILIHSFHSVLAPAFYIMFVAVLCFASCYLSRQTKSFNPTISLQVGTV